MAGNPDEAGEGEDAAVEDAAPGGVSYDYLLTMPIASLTLEKARIHPRCADSVA